MASSEDDDGIEIANHHQELPQGNEKSLIEYYFHKGFTNKQIVLMLQKHHDITMHERTLKRRLQGYGLKRRQELDNDLLEHARAMISRELHHGPGQLHGYRAMWHILRLRYHLHVPRSFVATVLREIDPAGVEERKRRSFQRRTYLSPGPNFCWHLDGYDKLKPYGFSVHGAIDGFSRRIIWLTVQQSNKNPNTVSKYFLEAIKTASGCPTRLYSDMGTENGGIAAMQCYLRSDADDEYAGENAHRYVPSTQNQRIECHWSLYRKQRAGWWIDFFKDMHESDLLDLTCDIEKEALWFCFANILQCDLDEFKEYHNSHYIRKSKHATVAGIPDIMYFLPEEHGAIDCLKVVSAQKIEELEERLNREANDIDTIWQDYFQYVMTNNNLSYPTSARAAGALFQTLTQYAKGE